MSLSTSQAAAELGVTPRQMRRAAVRGRIVAARSGAAHAFSPRQVQAFERTAHRGRDWSPATQMAALDLLSSGKTLELTSTERSRLKQRIRSSEVGALAGQILRGRVTLRRAVTEDAKKSFRSALGSELGLSAGGGLGVLVAEDSTHAARRARLGLDDSGDIAVVEGKQNHSNVLEAMVLFMYGDARESAAAARWISAAQKVV